MGRQEDTQTISHLPHIVGLDPTKHDPYIIEAYQKLERTQPDFLDRQFKAISCCGVSVNLSVLGSGWGTPLKIVRSLRRRFHDD